jgi:hypothetical protein
MQNAEPTKESFIQQPLGITCVWARKLKMVMKKLIRPIPKFCALQYLVQVVLLESAIAIN